MRYRLLYQKFCVRVMCGAVVIGVLAVVAGCTERVAGRPIAPTAATVDRPSSSPKSDASRSRQSRDHTTGTEHAEKGESTGSTAGTGTDPGGPGPGGAPWDPCEVISWDDLPGEKPDGADEPSRRSGTEDTQYTTVCWWKATSNDIAVMWGPAGRAKVEPATGPGQKSIEISGLPGLQAADVDSSGRLTCMAKIDLGVRGVFGVVVRERSSSDSGEQEPCLVANRLAVDVANRTP